MKTRTVAVALLLSAAAGLPFAAEERINPEINSRIRDEGSTVRA